MVGARLVARAEERIDCGNFTSAGANQGNGSPEIVKPQPPRRDMTNRVKVADLPEFDAARYLDSDIAIAAYLTDILEANNRGLLEDERLLAGWGS